MDVRPLRLALAQINSTVGDLAGNVEKVKNFANRAKDAGADMVIFPELAITGYPPEDLLLRPSFVAEAQAAIGRLIPLLPKDVVSVIGTVEKSRLGLYNAAAVISGGSTRGYYGKRLLPNYGVFDEKRYFSPGRSPLLLKIGEALVGFTVCEDIWVDRGPAWESARRGASLIVNISASPYHAGKIQDRFRMIRRRVEEIGCPVAYCNLVGGQDELVFDGASFVMDEKTRVLGQAPQFDEHLLVVDLPLAAAKKGAKGVRLPVPATAKPEINTEKHLLLPEVDEVHAALVLGARDYVRKNGFQKVLIGLSGGIDSSLVACVAAEALGPENVMGVTMPSRFNSDETRSDAGLLARNLGISFETVPIEPVREAYEVTLKPVFGNRPPDLTEENLQARIRGTLLMAMSNKFGSLVLTTGNKSETSVGYSTLYGDTAGGFAVIKDIPKTLVYKLSERVNEKAGREIIPKSAIERAPTAELRPNQKDQDSLPPYDVLDKVISLYVEEDKGVLQLVRAGVDAATARRVIRMIDMAEYKRRQNPPGVKITPKAFGRDRRMPVTNRYSPNA